MQVAEVVDEGVHFGDATLTYGSKTLINEGFARAATPARLNIKLFPHQETAVQALLDHENKRVYAVYSARGVK